MNKIINKNSIEESKKQKIRKFVFNPSLTKLEREFFFINFFIHKQMSRTVFEPGSVGNYENSSVDRDKDIYCIRERLVGLQIRKCAIEMKLAKASSSENTSRATKKNETLVIAAERMCSRFRIVFLLP